MRNFRGVQIFSEGVGNFPGGLRLFLEGLGFFRGGG